MHPLDLVVLLLYLLGLVGVGVYFYQRNKNSSDMFNAGGQSPWWVSGLSAFMTMFSAGTFVVWGGIAFRYGAVAIAISMCYGIAAFIAGRLLAGRWKRLGVESATEYLGLRFGPSIVQFMTWLQGLVGLFTLGGTLYALAVVVAALIQLPPGSPLADPATGRLSVDYLSLALCAVVIVVTMVGGLWAVLMTDVLQFIVLSVSVAVVVPLIIEAAGGWTAFVAAAPEGFFAPVAADFTWVFLTLWVVVHAFKIGGEWAFVQRFTCVPNARSAQRAAYLFGVMYLVSPIFWMLPPMVYRVVNPTANPEDAYILACRHVLPPGLVGLMIAAMVPATMSTATTLLNVYAGAFTTEVYRRLLRQAADPAREVFVGRMITVILGLITVAGTLLIPRLGTLTNFIITLTSLITGPFVLPSIWGLFSRRLSLAAVWWITLGSLATGLLVKFGLLGSGFLTATGWGAELAALLAAHQRVTDLCLGTLPPLLLLAGFELLQRRTDPGWDRIEATRARYVERAQALQSPVPANLCAVSLLWLALVLGGVALIDVSHLPLIGGAAAALAALAAAIALVANRRRSPS